MRYTLKRLRSGPEGTFGELYDPHGKLLCRTAERPWLNNEPRVSCIPEGVYPVIRHGWEPNTTVSKPKTWQLLNVPRRDDILIHIGNLPLVDSLGCILAGTAFGDVDGHPAVVGSRDAVAKLREILPESFEISVQ